MIHLDSDDDGCQTLVFKPNEIKTADMGKGRYVYVQGEYVATLTRRRESVRDYRDLVCGYGA